MNFNLEKSLEVLERTPAVLRSLLENLSTEWTESNEGEDTWSAYDIIGHLIHGERTDWVERAKIILSDGSDKNFKPFDRFAQFTESAGKSIHDLLNEFDELRRKNIEIIISLNLSENDLSKKGIHPAFGEVTLSQLISTWVVHDLNHIAQISRVMAKQYISEVGPWIEYLRILK